MGDMDIDKGRDRRAKRRYFDAQKRKRREAARYGEAEPVQRNYQRREFMAPGEYTRGAYEV